MSLPSYAKFYDKNDKEIGYIFINVGWFIDIDRLIDNLVEFPVIYHAEYVVVYHYKIPMKLLNHDSKIGEWRDRLRDFLMNCCKHQFESVHPSSGSPDKPYGQRCTICGHQEWY